MSKLTFTLQWEIENPEKLSFENMNEGIDLDLCAFGFKKTEDNSYVGSKQTTLFHKQNSIANGLATHSGDERFFGEEVISVDLEIVKANLLDKLRLCAFVNDWEASGRFFGYCKTANFTIKHENDIFYSFDLKNNFPTEGCVQLGELDLKTGNWLPLEEGSHHSMKDYFMQIGYFN